MSVLSGAWRVWTAGRVVRGGQVQGFCEQSAKAVWGHNSAERTFEQFVNTYMKDAYHIALGLVGNQDDALELSQEAFLKAYQHRRQLASGSKMFPWFYRILRNLCFSHLRSRKVRQAASLDESRENGPDVACGDAFDPHVITDADETKRRLWSAMARLDEKHREVIILRHFRNLSYDQMAEVLFCNKGTVTSRLYYARQKLKEMMDSEKGGQQ